MKTFSARPGASALLEYCKIRPGFEASFTIKPGLYTYLQCVWRLALCFDRKKSRKRTGSSKNICHLAALLRNMTSSNKCAKNVHVLVLYMYKYGPLRTWPWRVALILFGIFKVGIPVHFLKASADFQKTYGGHPRTKWRVVYMGNCTHFHPETSFNSVIWTELKVVPG